MSQHELMALTVVCIGKKLPPCEKLAMDLVKAALFNVNVHPTDESTCLHMLLTEIVDPCLILLMNFHCLNHISQTC